MDRNGNSAQDEAAGALSVIEGTVLRDIRSACEWAREFDARERDPSLGGLNFSLALLALLACEAGGFFITGAKYHKDDRHVERGASSGYIMAFIERFFPPRSAFKQLAKVLAEYLRHALVHGFGSVSPGAGCRLAVFVDADTSRDLRAIEDDQGRMLAINGIALAEQTIEAFRRVRELAARDQEFAENFECARRREWQVSGGVLRQFNVVWDDAKRRGLTSFVRPRASPSASDAS